MPRPVACCCLRHGLIMLSWRCRGATAVTAQKDPAAAECHGLEPTASPPSPTSSDDSKVHWRGHLLVPLRSEMPTAATCYRGHGESEADK